jgi:hypothetical protein
MKILINIREDNEWLGKYVQNNADGTQYFVIGKSGHYFTLWKTGIINGDEPKLEVNKYKLAADFQLL